MAALAEFERGLLRERVRSGIAAAQKRRVVFGRRPGQRVKSDRLTPKVLRLVGAGQSYREIGHRLGVSKNTVLSIVKRDRAASPARTRKQPILILALTIIAVFSFGSSRARSAVPFTPAGDGHDTIPAFVNGRGPFAFILDTGADGSTLYKWFAEKEHLSKGKVRHDAGR